MPFVEILLNEGEYLTNMWDEDGYLFIQSNLGRKWKSTHVPNKYMDLIEIN